MITGIVPERVLHTVFLTGLFTCEEYKLHGGTRVTSRAVVTWGLEDTVIEEYHFLIVLLRGEYQTTSMTCLRVYDCLSVPMKHPLVDTVQELN